MNGIDFDELIEKGLSPILSEELKEFMASDPDSEDVEFLKLWLKIMFV